MLNNLVLKPAVAQNISAIITLLSEDFLGSARENHTHLAPYLAAFNEIQQTSNIQLLVIELNQEIIATCQLVFIPCLSHQGAKRLEIEAVRVKATYRGQGIGKWMIQQIITIARQNNCQVIQLTSNKQRLDAHRFYASLGFINSHEGMKLSLT